MCRNKRTRFVLLIPLWGEAERSIASDGQRIIPTEAEGSANLWSRDIFRSVIGRI
jgi:hypothetical protein